MWSKWIEDSEEELDKIYLQDVYQNFETIDKFIRNEYSNSDVPDDEYVSD